jgi:hypothetical protein
MLLWVTRRKGAEAPAHSCKLKAESSPVESCLPAGSLCDPGEMVPQISLDKNLKGRAQTLFFAWSTPSVRIHFLGQTGQAKTVIAARPKFCF